MQHTPTVPFSSLKLAQPLLDAIASDGYANPTPIQAQAIPPAVEGRDVLGIAQTGTGKTAAFALPILNHLLERLPRNARPPLGRKPKALVLSPTRELAVQIAESFSSYGRHTPLRFTVIFGGVGQGPQVRAIQQGVDILVATPGRLIDLLQQKLVSLAEIDFFVLDEADRMLDMGFIEPIRKIAAMLPKERQTMLFSATMPKEIRHLADSLLSNPVSVAVTPVSSAVDRIDQKLYFVLKAQKTQLLVHLFESLAMDRAVVFTKTKHGADRLCRKLKAANIRAEAIHGDKAQNQRIRALDAFRAGRAPVLVATDVAARGLDIDDVTHVVNYDLPMEPEAYVHRIGRTARAGKSGHAISFCDTEERGLLKQVERLIKFEIPRERVPNEVPKSDESAHRAALDGKPEAPMIEVAPASARHAPQSESRHAPQSESRHAPQSESRHAPQSESRHAPQSESRHAPQSESRHAPKSESRGDSRGAPRGGSRPQSRPDGRGQATASRSATQRDTSGQRSHHPMPGASGRGASGRGASGGTGSRTGGTVGRTPEGGRDNGGAKPAGGASFMKQGRGGARRGPNQMRRR